MGRKGVPNRHRWPLRARIYAQTEFTKTCWVWKGNKDRKGYGIASHNRQEFRTHRLSWIMHIGEIPEGMWVLHKCDNPSCINPDHLFLGTSDDNVRDRNEKGRTSHGERQSGKLRREDVWAIRKEPRYRGSRAVVAAKYGVSKSAIDLILKGASWKRV
jgi:hypothetical protein